MGVAAETICRHFGTCGGCSYQDMPSRDYAELKQGTVASALARAGLAETRIDPLYRIAAGTRRRATFKAEKRGVETLFGFHAEGSHTIVDMLECRVLTPALQTLVPSLRDMMASRLADGGKAELYAVEADNGVDVSLHGTRATAPLSTWAATWATKLRLSRVTAEKDILVQSNVPEIHFADVRVLLPSDAFLQPTREGERFLREQVSAAAKGARNVADLFCGLGTFSLPLAQSARVQAFDADSAAVAALAAAVRGAQRLKPLTVFRRDLFRAPLTAPELAAFDLVVLDPPRAGAGRQIGELARSKVSRIVYVSCSPQTFARDAAVLVAAGYRLGTVKPVDQFVWSSHIELVAEFARN